MFKRSKKDLNLPPGFLPLCPQCKDMVMVARPLLRLVRFECSHGIKPKVVVQSQIGQLELPPIRRISLGSQVFNLGKFDQRGRSSNTSNLTYLGWTPVTFRLPRRIKLANQITKGVGTVAEDSRRGNGRRRHGKKDIDCSVCRSVASNDESKN